MRIDRDRRSPNHGVRAPGCGIDMLVLHYTGMRSEDGAIGWLCDPRSEVSSHYVVREDGTVLQLVDEDRRAWHAGRSFWRGVTDVNSHSIGIEICNPGHEFGYRPFPVRQIDAVTELCLDILGRHAVAPRNVVAHSDVAPLRKEDPGELFPWRRLASAGVGLHVEPSSPTAGPSLWPGDSGSAVTGLQESLSSYGYDVPTSGRYCDHTAAVVTAFQRHFRQDRIDGVADAATVDTLDRLVLRVAAHSF